MLEFLRMKAILFLMAVLVAPVWAGDLDEFVGTTYDSGNAVFSGGKGMAITRNGLVVQDGDLAPVRHDFLGINFYCNTRIGHRVADDHPSRARVIDRITGSAVESASVGQLTDMGWPVTPYGIGDLLVRWTREYGDLVPQMFITENGMANADRVVDGRVPDHARISYLSAHLRALATALQSVRVRLSL